MQRKSGFLTFCFACLPGAGEMYLGYMKRGLSVMIAFWGLIFVASLLNSITSAKRQRSASTKLIWKAANILPVLYLTYTPPMTSMMQTAALFLQLVSW